MSRKIVLSPNFGRNINFKKDPTRSTNYYSSNYKPYPKRHLINKSGHKYVNIPGLINKNIEKKFDPELLEHYFSNSNNLFNPNMRAKVTNARRHLTNPYRNKTKNKKYNNFLGKHRNILPYSTTRRRQNKKKNPFKFYKRRTLRTKRANNTETPRSIVNLPKKRNTKKRKINNVYNNNINMINFSGKIFEAIA